MERWAYSNVWWAGVLVIVGIACVFLSGAMQIRRYRNTSGKNIAYSAWLIGFGLLLVGALHITVRMSLRMFLDETKIWLLVAIMGGVSLAVLFSLLVTLIVQIWVQKRAPNANFPPLDKK